MLTCTGAAALRPTVILAYADLCAAGPRAVLAAEGLAASGQVQLQFPGFEKQKIEIKISSPAHEVKAVENNFS